MKPWYHFICIVDYFNPERSEVVFPKDPTDNQIGQAVEKYLLDSDFYRQDKIPGMSKDSEEVRYLAKNRDVDLSKIVKLQFKFASKGAVLKENKTKITTASTEGFATKEEVAELKKQLNSNQERLLSLKEELRQLEISEEK